MNKKKKINLLSLAVSLCKISVVLLSEYLGSDTSLMRRFLNFERSNAQRSEKLFSAKFSL